MMVPEGLIAHGRGEAFDYLLGEKSTASAMIAERAAAARLLLSDHPVISVNGNVAALASNEVAALTRALPALQVEVNLFHRTPARAQLVREKLEEGGVKHVLGVHPTARLRGLASDRGWVDEKGILVADTVLIPLEDGDRALAMKKAGKHVISIDLNPLSRTTVAADIPIIDELKRALSRIRREAVRLKGKSHDLQGLSRVDAEDLRSQAIDTIGRRIKRLSSSEPPVQRRRIRT